MAYFRCGGGGIPSSIKTDMNAVLNKKFGTQGETYPPTEWADDVNLMGVLPIRTASGTIAHFEDGAEDVPMKSLTANIVPIQSGTGTPSPSNPRPITGTDELTLTQTGKNIFSIIPKLEELHITYSVDNDGWITLPTISQASSALYASPSKIPLLNNGSALFLIDAERSTATNVRLRLYKDGTAVTETPSGNNPVNRREDFSFNEVGLNWSQSGSATFKIVIVNAPTIETTYEPYNAETYTFDLGQEIMGGTADCVGGVGEKKRAKIVLDGTTDPTRVNWRPQTNTIGWLYDYSLTSNKIVTSSVLPNLLADTQSTKTYSDLFNNDIEGVGVYTSSDYGLVVRVADTSLTTKEAINTYLSNNPITIVFELATPTEYTFTGQPINSYLGVNNLYTDSGEVLDVEYRADMNLLIAELEG